MFNLIPEPVDYEDMKTTQFEESEVIAVGPEENGGDDEGLVPEEIAITMAYFQQNEDEKLLIKVDA